MFEILRILSHTPSRAAGAGRTLALASLVVTAAAATIACGSTGTEESLGEQWQAETTIEGDVTTVHTLGGSVWRGPARLDENLSIGVDQGEDAYMFGRIAGVAFTDDRVYVLDAGVPALRVYDWSGQHLLDIGQEGDGPGEFRRPSALALMPDGRILVKDRTRITFFGPGGEYLEDWPLDRGGFAIEMAGLSAAVTDDGTVYTLGRVGEMPTDFSAGGFMRLPIGMVPRGPDGPGEGAIPRPEFDYEPPRLMQEQRSGGNVMIRMQGVPLVAQIVWAMSPSGAVLGGGGSDYSFDISYPDGRTTRVRKDYEPVPVDPEERAWHTEQTTAQMRVADPEWVWNIDELPTVKAAFDQLFPDHSGRVWVGRPGAGIGVPECEKDPETGVWEPDCWRSERSYEVFDLEGRFLGAVDAPERFRVSPTAYIRGDTILTQIEDEFGTYTVKGYQLVTPGNE